ncbi:hypothetical protein [Pedobacter nototheniae]|uniref:hypothetical protein n=1 Tax=Pedobacter nototheniae TaxID=2488994 RepID=UPI00103D43B7|nr:hypothetical protein [Pedobacter nototheniae]
MKPSLPKLTAEVLAYKALNRDFDKNWINWAIEMLINGFDTEHLVILAGMSEPFDYFEMQALTTKVLNELGLDYSNKLKSGYDYISYLINLCFENKIKPIAALREIMDLYLELSHESSIQHFYFLYYAKVDLIEDEVQWYIDGVDRSNIDETILNYFREWLDIHPLLID